MDAIVFKGSSGGSTLLLGLKTRGGAERPLTLYLFAVGVSLNVSEVWFPRKLKIGILNSWKQFPSIL